MYFTSELQGAIVKTTRNKGFKKSRKYSAQKYPTGIPGCPENMGEWKKGA